MKTHAFLIAVVFLSLSAVAQTQPKLNQMPMPTSVQTGAGQLAITQSFSVAVTGGRDASLDSEVQRFVKQLSKQTGIPFRPKDGAAATLQIHADHGREAVQKLGEDESYTLTVTDSGGELNARPLWAPRMDCRLCCNLSRSLPRDLPCQRSRSKISLGLPGAAC
jgi:hexosaminidase